MNLLYISPEFPPNFQNFIIRLAEANVKVWAIGEADFYSLPEAVRHCLSWYVRTNLNDYHQALTAVQSMIDANPQLKEHGFQAVESHNEHWLRLESLLNEAYNIDGVRSRQLDCWKKKSAMKEIFVANDIPVARGARVTDHQQALRLAQEWGYPVILKPDEGVGANKAYKVGNEGQLHTLLPQLSEDYFIEEFVAAQLLSYDGLTDAAGNVVFESSLVYSEGVLEYMYGKDPSFYITREIPTELAHLGQAIVQIFGIRRKFFHFEFFAVGDGYLPLEINVRPPGGPIVDMMNYSIDDDLYRGYARMIATGSTGVVATKKYYCGYVGRRDRDYRYSIDEIMQHYGHCFVDYQENALLYHQAMGRYRCIFRSPDREDIYALMRYLLA